MCLKLAAFTGCAGIKFADPQRSPASVAIAGTFKSSSLRRVESADFEEIGGGDFTVCAKLLPPS